MQKLLHGQVKQLIWPVEDKLRKKNLPFHTSCLKFTNWCFNWLISYSQYPVVFDGEIFSSKLFIFLLQRELHGEAILI